MKGSEKQVKWAENILNGLFGTIESNIRTARERFESTGCKAYERDIEVWEKVAAYFAPAKTIDDARHIIDKRDALSSAAAFRVADRIRCFGK